MTTTDRNALVVSVEEFVRLMRHVPRLRILVNRSPGGASQALFEFREQLGPLVDALDLAPMVHTVAEDRDLARIFHLPPLHKVPLNDSIPTVLRLAEKT